MPTFDEFLDAIALLVLNSDEPYFGLGSLCTGEPGITHIERKCAEVYIQCMRKHAERCFTTG